MFTRGQRYEKRYSLVLFYPFFYITTNEKYLKMIEITILNMFFAISWMMIDYFVSQSCPVYVSINFSCSYTFMSQHTLYSP